MPENAQENLQMLLEICLLLSSKLDLADLLKAILSLASRVVKSETASLLLLDPATQELYFHVALGMDPDVAKMRLKIGQGIAGTVAQGGKPIIIDDVHSDPLWSSAVDKQTGFQTRSILAAPMTIKGRLVGVVEAINHIQGPFSADDQLIFEAFASQAAIAIDNAQLFFSLNEEKAKLDMAFSQMQEGVLLANERGDVLLANPAAGRLLGFINAPPTSLSQALAGTRVTPALNLLASASMEPSPLEIIRDQPKKLVLEGTLCSFKFNDVASQHGSIVHFLVFRDVTDERQEDLLKRRFLSLISHKLKTPLASIMGFSEVLISEPNLPAQASLPLQTIGAQAKKLAELVEKLLAFTTLEGLDPAQLKRMPFVMDKAIREALASLEGWLQAQKAEVAVEVGSGMSVYGDIALVEQALKHLIENGIKFNPNTPKKLAIRSIVENGFVVVKVQDNGPGIPPEDLDKVFTKFHQVEASFTGQVEGVGLGLPFVKRVVEFHGGRLWLESRLAEGTTAALALPRPPVP